MTLLEKQSLFNFRLVNSLFFPQWMQHFDKIAVIFYHFFPVVIILSCVRSNFDLTERSVTSHSVVIPNREFDRHMRQICFGDIFDCEPKRMKKIRLLSSAYILKLKFNKTILVFLSRTYLAFQTGESVLLITSVLNLCSLSSSALVLNTFTFTQGSDSPFRSTPVSLAAEMTEISIFDVT